MHQQVDDTNPIVLITDDTTRAEIEEAMHHIRTVLDRMPAHWVDRRAALHGKLDALLTDWERAPDGRPSAPDA